MNLTKESQYALKGLACLASFPPGTMVSLADIAEAQDLPGTFLAKIFQKLARHGLLDAERGRGSGYTLAHDPRDLRVREVLIAIEGPLALQRCLLWGGHCSDEDPCPLHYRLKLIRPQLDALIDETTLAGYIESANDGPHSSKDAGVTS